MQRPLAPMPPEARLEAAAVDLQHLSRYTLGDRALEAEVLALFAMQLPATIDALRGAGGETEWRTAAHTLKGSARTVGAWRLAQLAAEAEYLAAVRDRGVVAAIAAAAREAEAFIAALAADPHRNV